MAASPLPSRGPKRGWKCYVTPAFSGVPNAKRREENQKCFPTKGFTNRSGCLTPAFSGAEKRAEMLRHPYILRVSPTPMAEANKKWFLTKGEENRSGCLTLAFSGAQKRVEMLRHTCILGGPQRQAPGAKSEVVPNKGVNKQKWLPQPFLLGGPKEGGNATSTLHSGDSPTPIAGRLIRSLPQQRGKQTEVAPSALPSRGPKRGSKCYITPAFLGVPNAKRGQENQNCSPTKG